MIWENIIVVILLLYIQFFPFILLLWLQISILKYQKKLFWIGGIYFLSIMGVNFSIGMEIVSGVEGESSWVKHIIWMTINYILMARQLYLIRKIKNTKEIKA
jgi:hypothetical protein